MQSRYPQTKVFDYCLNPLHLKDLDKDVVVPCGKCAGCRVHAANVWSMRLGMEIESCPYSVFVTPTYNNWYLPRLVCIGSDGDLMVAWSSSHRDNWRFAGSRSSLRNDNIELVGNFSPVCVTNDVRSYLSIPYASKLDVQLYLKLIRKYLSSHGFQTDKFGRYFRYFAISEYGETKYCPHYHIIFFPLTYDVFREFVNGSVLYSCWQMCDENLFVENIKPCNSGTRNYLTQYVNSFTNLPKVYQESAIRPFRLASKNPAIGYFKFDLKEIFENLSIGVSEYNRAIPRLSSNYVLEYPKVYLSSIFPKCKEYRRKSYDALLRVYGRLYRYRKCLPSVIDTASDRLSQSMCPSDYNAARKMYKIYIECEKRYGIHISCFHYVFLLDMYYYKADMYALKLMYEYESCHSFLDNLRLYSNFAQYVLKLRSGYITNSERVMLKYFCDGFYIDYLSLFDIDLTALCGSSRPNAGYVNELSDILESMVKMPKTYEKLGVSPVNQFI